MKTTVLSALILLGATGAHAAGSLNPDKRPGADLIAFNCGVCHGSFGQAFGESMPPLAGMNEDKFVTAMIDFRDGKRPGTIMSRIAPAFTEDDYRAIAAYFAAQEPVPYPQEADQ